MPDRYTPNYDDPTLRGDEEPRPWDICEVAAEHMFPSAVVLDVGCGTGRKTFHLAQRVRSYIGMDPSPDMRLAAMRRVVEEQLEHVSIIEGSAERIPLRDESVDVIVNIMATSSASEFARVLKPSGIAIIEKASEVDKAEIKSEFPPDASGPRGQFSEYLGVGRAASLRGDFERCFASVEVAEAAWKGHLTRDGLEALLSTTNVVRSFDSRRDAEVIDRICRERWTDRGVRVTHARIKILAKK